MRRYCERDKNVRNNNLKTPVKTDIGQPKIRNVGVCLCD